MKKREVYLIVGIFIVLTLLMLVRAENESLVYDSETNKVIINTEQNTNVLELKEVIIEEDYLNISYEFDNSDFIGGNMGVVIWINDINNSEYLRVPDNFPINREGPIKRNVIFNLPKNLKGVYYLNIALANDPDEYIKQQIILGESKGTGMVVLAEGSGGKAIVYGIFMLIVIVTVFFIIKSGWKADRKNWTEIGDKKEKIKKT